MTELITAHPRPWATGYTQFGESEGYDSKSVIVDANGARVLRIGNGVAKDIESHENLAEFIVRAVNVFGAAK